MKSLLGLVALFYFTGLVQGQEWQIAQTRLLTRWARQVRPENAHPEYPRPQFVRDQWLNLNGLWDLAITELDSPVPVRWPMQILVPFPIESALSGIGRPVSPKERLWYRKTFEIPATWKGFRILLHFGAVDWETKVWVNGRFIGTHRGGYDPFSFDITEALRPEGPQEVIVSAWDPTDTGYQPRGKQVLKPGGIWYTSCSGIWQTVWLEPVAQTFIESVYILPDIDKQCVTIKAKVQAPDSQTIFEASAYDGNKLVAASRAQVSSQDGTAEVTLHIPEPKLWSPESPFLYDLMLTLRNGERVTDRVTSYFGMRKIQVAKDKEGVPRLFLNNKPYFMFGPLDQGYWPDGIYTAPTDEALRYDIQITKLLGFNMCRKHVKVEPARWYYWCDKLGLLVWQDMPSGDRFIGPRQSDIERSEQSAQQFLKELKAMIDTHFNHPCIVMWVPYNEGWGQWNTTEVVKLIKQWDPTRLVNNASGWQDRGVGDVVDMHEYPGPNCPNWDANRAAVLGEFGGLGLPIEGHTWQAKGNWGYRAYSTADELFLAYKNLIDRLPRFIKASGLSAAVYTQTTDVEVEVNGLMTYDREIIKMGIERVRQVNQQVYKAIEEALQPAEERINSSQFIPPAIPLIVCDPYFSIWSFTDHLHSDFPRHWTGRPHTLVSLVRIDGKPFRLMGIDPADIPPLPQTAVSILPTRTVYTFRGCGVEITLTFLTPTIPYDIDLLSRSVGYISWELRSVDGQPHQLELYFDNTAELVVNEPSQLVNWQRFDLEGLAVVQMGSVDQTVLARSGDDLRIDWGYLYTAAPLKWTRQWTVGPAQIRQQFANTGSIPSELDPNKPRAARDNWPVAAFVLEVGQLDSRPIKRWLMLAYDDIFSIQYMGHNLRAFWRRHGWQAADLLKASVEQYEMINHMAGDLDERLLADAQRLGGEIYAKIVSLAFRQAFGANKFVADQNGQPLSFAKECFSNGCIGTVDVFYPMSPLFLLFGPSLAKSMLVPVLNYASSDRWKFPFAPHDLGQYPLANGQVYGGGEHSEHNQMPVEESGNMLILLAAVARMDGNAEFAARWWPTIQKWAEYLLEKGFDPENQLCTDDFAGHLAHNVNLSAKAILGLASFAYLAELRGEQQLATRFRQAARQFAQKWIEQADDGDHFRLAFDQPNTWSQKYNLVWDRILNFNLWPQQIKEKEMRFYRTVQNRYGLPLDNRALYTKLDWIIWTATLTQQPQDFQALLKPVYRFLIETPDRIPMTDWYWTHNGRQRGFQARPVVGAVFIQFLYDLATWEKYAKLDRTGANNWAGFPPPIRFTILLPTAETKPELWRYTLSRPADNWTSPEYDDRNWPQGIAGFGTRGTPGARVSTTWNTQEIWLRRDFELDSVPAAEGLLLRIHHDEDAEVYINGVLAARLSGYVTNYMLVQVREEAARALRRGRNVIAVHCKQTAGGQYIDVGLVVRDEQ